MSGHAHDSHAHGGSAAALTGDAQARFRPGELALPVLATAMAITLAGILLAVLIAGFSPDPRDATASMKRDTALLAARLTQMAGRIERLSGGIETLDPASIAARVEEIDAKLDLMTVLPLPDPSLVAALDDLDHRFDALLVLAQSPDARSKTAQLGHGLLGAALELDRIAARIEERADDIAGPGNSTGHGTAYPLLVGLLLILFLCASGLAWLSTSIWRERDHDAESAEGNLRLLQDLVETSADWTFETDEKLRLRKISAHSPGIFPDAGDALIGRPFFELFADEPTDTLPGRQALFEATESRRRFRDLVVEAAVDPRSSGLRVHRVSGRPHHDANGRFLGFRGTGSDITGEVRRARHVRFLAEHDQLTRLPNGRLLRERISRALRGDRQSDGTLTLMVVDLDHFKAINESFGHETGDHLLVAVSGRLDELLRDGDFLARFEGDAFAILLSSRQADRKWVFSLADRFISSLCRPYIIGNQEVRIRASIGIAFLPDHGQGAEELVHAAEIATLAAKSDGRSRWKVYEPGFNSELLNRQKIELLLRRALEEDRLQIVYQPQVRLADRTLIGGEALVRWDLEELQARPFDQLIAVAEDCGLIVDIGKRVLERACSDALAWPRGVVGVNVSPAQFIHEGLVETVEAALAASGLPADRLELEITEGVLMRHEEAAIADLQRLRALGIRIAVDDFGTGYSSLAYLKRLPVQKVKVDRSFIRDLPDGADDRKIVKAIIHLAEALGLDTIAEGIETDDQADFLTELGCDLGQGFLFGKPMTAQAFTSLWKSPAPICEHPGPRETHTIRAVGRSHPDDE
ncbi:MAG: EAL domain-containing protein [Geminicoccaceae bacterium]